MYSHTNDYNNPNTYSHTYSHPLSQTLCHPNRSNIPKTSNNNNKRAKSFGRADDFGFQFSSSKPSSEYDLLHNRKQNHYSKPGKPNEGKMYYEDGNTSSHYSMNCNYDNMFVGNIYDNHIPNEYEYHMNYTRKLEGQNQNRQISLDISRHVPFSKQNGGSWNNVLETNHCESLNTRISKKPFVSYSNGPQGQIYFSNFPPNETDPNSVVNPLAMQAGLCLPLNSVYPDQPQILNPNIPVNHITTIHNHSHNHRHSHIYHNHDSPRHKIFEEVVTNSRRSSKEYSRRDNKFEVQPNEKSKVNNFHYKNNDLILLKTDTTKDFDVDNCINFNISNSHILTTDQYMFRKETTTDFKPISPKISNRTNCVLVGNSSINPEEVNVNTRRNNFSHSVVKSETSPKTTNQFVLRESDEVTNSCTSPITISQKKEVSTSKKEAIFIPLEKRIETLECKYPGNKRILRRASPKQRGITKESMEAKRKGSESTPNMDNLHDSLPSPNFEAWASSRAVFVMPPSRFMDEPAYSSTF